MIMNVRIIDKNVGDIYIMPFAPDDTTVCSELFVEFIKKFKRSLCGGL